MEVWLVPCTDGTFDIVVGHDIMGSASSITKAFAFASRAQWCHHGVIILI